MHIASQFSFLGGMDTRIEPSKLGNTKYPLLFNGRIKRNTIKPVRKHLKLDAPAGEKQGLYAAGNLLVLFVNGYAYWKDVTSSVLAWQGLADWTPMKTTGRIYAEVVPISYYQGTISYDNSNPDLGDTNKITFPGLEAPTAAQLFVTDGTNRRVINPDGSWRKVQEYNDWTTSSPEYVPLCVLPKRAGQKLYCVDPVNRNKIYHSVSGRFLDFVINRNSTGDKNGDAETTFKAVDFNPTTALIPLSDGALFVGTLYASYVVVPDYSDTFFGEPLLPESTLFPTGPVNERSFAGINHNGAYDMAFITQLGIQSFNVTKQARFESNNFPLGTPIADILDGIQANTAACNFDLYALFSVSTVYGKVVLVYDNTLEAFVSIDTGFGEVVDFAVVKTNGQQKLYFTNSADELFEAYGDTVNAICRVQIGDFAYTTEVGQVAGVQYRANNVKLQFGDVKESTDIQVSLYADKKLIQTAGRSISPADLVEAVPWPVPYPSSRQCEPIAVKFTEAPYCWKAGVFVEWSGEAQLYSASFFGDTISSDAVQVLTPSDREVEVLTVFSDTKFTPTIADTVTMTSITGLTEGQWYSVVGQLHDGRRVIENAIFQAPGKEVNLLGNLRTVGLLKTTYDRMTALRPGLMIGCGDHAYDAGTLVDVTHFSNLFKYSQIALVGGNHDQDTDTGKYFWTYRRQPRYYKYEFSDKLHIFLLNSGYNTALASTEPDGNTSSSVQADWLRENLSASNALHKIVVLHHPPYTDDISYSPGYSALRWPFAAWGASMVLSGHAHNYQRFSVDNIPYVVIPTASDDIRGFAAGVNTSEVRFQLPGFLKLTLSKFNITAELVASATGDILDVFGIYG